MGIKKKGTANRALRLRNLFDDCRLATSDHALDVFDVTHFKLC